MTEQSTSCDDGKTKLDHLTDAQYSLLKAQQILSHAVQSAILAKDYPQLDAKPIKYDAMKESIILNYCRA